MQSNEDNKNTHMNTDGIERIKVTVNLTQEDINRLQELSELTGLTMTHVLRQSIASWHMLKQFDAEGRKILITETTGNIYDKLRELIIK